MLLPDEFHGPVYAKDIAPAHEGGQSAELLPRLQYHLQADRAAANVDVIMVAPKSPASEERKAFLQGFGVPGLISVRQNASGKARDIALAMAKTMGFTRAAAWNAPLRKRLTKTCSANRWSCAAAASN